MAHAHFRMTASPLLAHALLVCIAVAAATLPAAAADRSPPTRMQTPAQAPAQAQAQATLAQPPLRSRAALDAWLAAQAGEPTPLDLLPPLARARFIDSLAFGHGGLGGFDTGDLATELTPAEAGRVLALFDAEDFAGAVDSRNAVGPPSWRATPGEPGRAVLAYDALYRIQRTDIRDPAPVRRRFAALPAALVDPAGFDALPERELVYLLRSFSLATFDVLDATDAERLRALVDAMEQRGLARTPDLRLVYDRLLAAREFDAARRYAAAHPDAELPALPQFLDAAGPTPPAMSIWRLRADGAALQRTAFDPVPLQIVVTAGCHFSEDAARDISSDPVLGPVFAGHASWLMLPPGKEDQEALREWNQRFPAAQAKQIYDRSEWTLLPPGWRMPGFFIVRDGKVVDHLFGWNPDGESRAALVAALQRAGLLPASSSAAQGPES